MKIPSVHIETGSLLYGLELVLQSREQVVCNLVIVQKKGTSFLIKQQHIGISFEDSIRLLKGKTHIIISITGKGVLLKRINSFSDIASDIIRQALPNTQAQDFYVQAVGIENRFFSGIIRLEWIEPWMQRYFDEKILFSNIIIGPYAAVILKQVNYQSQQAFQVNRYKFIYENDKLNEVAVSENNREEEIKIENTVVRSDSIIGFCSLLATQTGLIQVSAIESDLLDQMRKEKKQQKRFRATLVASVISVFVVLLVNLVISRQYGARYANLDGEVAENQSKLNLIENLEREIKNKKELLGGNISHGPVLSYVADELASSVPSAIKLTEMNVFPVQGKIRKDEPITYEKNKIRVSGSTQRSQDLNKWIKDIRQLEWVKDISIINYTHPQPGNEGEFQLLIMVEA